MTLPVCLLALLVTVQDRGALCTSLELLAILELELMGSTILALLVNVSFRLSRGENQCHTPPRHLISSAETSRAFLSWSFHGYFPDPKAIQNVATFGSAGKGIVILTVEVTEEQGKGHRYGDRLERVESVRMSSCVRPH